MFYKAVIGLSLLIFSLYTYRKAYGTRIYYFYKDSCPHCKKIRPAWDLFTASVSWSLITPIEIDCDGKNQKLRDNFGAKTVPYIVKVIDDAREVYKGDRLTENILAWSKQPIQL